MLTNLAFVLLAIILVVVIGCVVYINEILWKIEERMESMRLAQKEFFYRLNQEVLAPVIPNPNSRHSKFVEPLPVSSQVFPIKSVYQDVEAEYPVVIPHHILPADRKRFLARLKF